MLHEADSFVRSLFLETLPGLFPEPYIYCVFHVIHSLACAGLHAQGTGCILKELTHNHTTMSNYKAFKSGGEWFLKNPRGKILAQQFASLGELAGFAKRLGLSVSFA